MNLNESNTEFGWIDNQPAVEHVLSTLPQPIFKSAAPSLMDTASEDKETLLYLNFRKVTGGDAPKGPQQIGDCVSWAWSNFINNLQITQIIDKLAEVSATLAGEFLVTPEEAWSAELKDTIDGIKTDSQYEYQEICTEATYGLSRVEVGGQRGSYQDGSVGAWAAKAATDWGYISRMYLENKLGAGQGKYNPDRAKKWGAQGLPNDLEPEAKTKVCKTVSLVTSFEEAAAAIKNLQTVPVCSNRGFTMTRDNQGFCSPQGVWYHAMLFCGVRYDRPGLLCSQSWGPNTPSGPRYKDQPDNTFWVDANVVDYMLRQRDSFTGNNFSGYIKRNYVSWAH